MTTGVSHSVSAVSFLAIGDWLGGGSWAYDANDHQRCIITATAITDGVCKGVDTSKALLRG